MALEPHAFSGGNARANDWPNPRLKRRMQHHGGIVKVFASPFHHYSTRIPNYHRVGRHVTADHCPRTNHRAAPYRHTRQYYGV